MMMVLQRANQVTSIIENGGCNEKTWSIGARFTHFWAWDLEVSDLNKDGNDDVMVLDLQADITTQRVVTYLGPVGSAQGIVTILGHLSRIPTVHSHR